MRRLRALDSYLRLLRLRDGGRIVAISAGLTMMPRPGTGFYSASKIALDQLVRVLAREIGHRGITVNSVMSGAVLTPALANAGEVVIYGQGDENAARPRR